MILASLPPEVWAAEGARSAAALEDVAAAVVIGTDAEAALAVAIALAMSQPADRRVAIGDLVGSLGPLRGDPGAPGLLECFRDGSPISDIARPLGDDPRVFALPSGEGVVAQRLVLESARWPRLISGFREVDALLLLVVRAGTPGLDTLIATVDGVVAIDLPPTVYRAWPLLATIDRPEPELPTISSSLPIGSRAVPRRAGGRFVVGTLVSLTVVTLALASAVAFSLTTRPGSGSASEAMLTPPLDAESGTSSVPSSDTITLGAVVNPESAGSAASFTLELIAANTLSGANSQLAMRGVRLPAPTAVPVQLGSDGQPWFRALTGAWQDRVEADAFLETLRARGLVRQGVGRVVRAPYALLLAKGLSPAEVTDALARWEASGIPAYALLQDDGRARVFAGAFETPGQSVLLALSLRDLGVDPVLAFRTGRTF